MKNFMLSLLLWVVFLLSAIAMTWDWFRFPNLSFPVFIFCSKVVCFPKMFTRQCIEKCDEKAPFHIVPQPCSWVLFLINFWECKNKETKKGWFWSLLQLFWSSRILVFIGTLYYQISELLLPPKSKRWFCFLNNAAGSWTGQEDFEFFVN